jgi:hypothetical protein
MRNIELSGALIATGVLLAGSAIAQTKPDATKRPPQLTAQKQQTDGDGLAMTGPASGANRQRTDGDAAPVLTLDIPLGGAPRNHCFRSGFRQQPGLGQHPTHPAPRCRIRHPARTVRPRPSVRD